MGGVELLIRCDLIYEFIRIYFESTAGPTFSLIFGRRISKSLLIGLLVHLALERSHGKAIPEEVWTPCDLKY